MNYHIRPRAERDLIEHFVFIARDKIVPADRFLKVAEESFDEVAKMPGLGRTFESDNRKLQGIRVYPMPSPYRNYLVFYQVSKIGDVEILTILHAARDIGSILAEIL